MYVVARIKKDDNTDKVFPRMSKEFFQQVDTNFPLGARNCIRYQEREKGTAPTPGNLCSMGKKESKQNDTLLSIISGANRDRALRKVFWLLRDKWKIIWEAGRHLREKG